MTTEKQKAAEKSAFDFIAFNVEKRGKKTYWTRLGAGWFHEDGEGFTAKLSAMPLSGEIVFRKPKPPVEKADQGEQAEATEATEGEGA